MEGCWCYLDKVKCQARECVSRVTWTQPLSPADRKAPQAARGLQMHGHAPGLAVEARYIPLVTPGLQNQTSAYKDSNTAKLYFKHRAPLTGAGTRSEQTAKAMTTNQAGRQAVTRCQRLLLHQMQQQCTNTVPTIRRSSLAVPLLLQSTFNRCAQI